MTMKQWLPARWTLVSLGVVFLALATGFRAPANEPDAALERTRAQAKMLDDLLKVAVVDITNRYDGPPAAKVAKSIFAAAKDKQYFEARLVDISGAPLNEEFGKAVGADAYCRDAAVAVETAKEFMKRKHNMLAG